MPWRRGNVVEVARGLMPARANAARLLLPCKAGEEKCAWVNLYEDGYDAHLAVVTLRHGCPEHVWARREREGGVAA
jgi:hypothetical protein